MSDERGEGFPETEYPYHTIAIAKGSTVEKYLDKMKDVHLLGSYEEAIEKLIIEFDPDLDFLTFEGEK
jgi:hypothetical protein